MPDKINLSSFERGKHDALVGYPPQEGVRTYLKGYCEGYELCREEKRQRGECPDCGEMLPHRVDTA